MMAKSLWAIQSSIGFLHSVPSEGGCNQGRSILNYFAVGDNLLTWINCVKFVVGTASRPTGRRTQRSRNVGSAPGRRRRKPHQHCRSFGVDGFLTQAVRRYWAKRQHPQYLRAHVMLMMATVAILMAAHVTEVLVWAATCAMDGATPAGASHVYLSHVYLSFVSYTTLGYGDVVPVSAWQLLGPLTAMNGILLFGWSTRSFSRWCEQPSATFHADLLGRLAGERDA
jgi:Ion channel